MITEEYNYNYSSKFPEIDPFYVKRAKISLPPSHHSRPENTKLSVAEHPLFPSSFRGLLMQMTLHELWGMQNHPIFFAQPKYKGTKTAERRAAPSVIVRLPRKLIRTEITMRNFRTFFGLNTEFHFSLTRSRRRVDVYSLAFVSA